MGNFKGRHGFILVSKYIKDSHFLCLPTRGENFGQIIYEAFSYGRPVIISDQTPWLNLRKKEAGWDVDISTVDYLRQAIYEASQLDSVSWIKFCENSLGIATKYNRETLSENINMFLS